MTTTPTLNKTYNLRFENGAELVVKYVGKHEGLYRFKHNNDEYGLYGLEAVSEITTSIDPVNLDDLCCPQWLNVIWGGKERTATVISCNVATDSPSVYHPTCRRTRINLEIEVTK